MIELLDGFHENVLAIKGSGQITKRDYNEIIIPAAEKKLAKHEKIRCYYELAEDFSGFELGAAWEDAWLGFEHLSRWERLAIVTDTDWLRLAVSAFSFLFPIRVFSLAEKTKAREWVSE